MIIRVQLIVIAILTLVTNSNGAVEESRELRAIYKQVRNILFGIFERTGRGRGLYKATASNKLQTPVHNKIPFPCSLNNTRSPTIPNSVHKLRPGDIDIVAAIGDSLTAANGAAATKIVHVATENRGMSATIGGQANWRKYLTIPNILKEFNPNLIGYSRSDSLGHHDNAQFNVAEPAAMSQDIFFMAKELVRRIKNDSRVVVDRDWKMILLFIGANDFCLNFCFLKERDFQNAAETHRRELMATLDYLRDNLPRTIVVILLTPVLKILRDLKMSPICDELHIFECPCLFGRHRVSTYPANIKMQSKWQKVQMEVANSERYRNKPDFTVALQTFTQNMTFPEVNGYSDSSLLSADCFHLSQKGHARIANALWNNLLEPYGKKSMGWDEPFSRFLCPTKEHPYIYTYKNSKV